jgi:YHS domain-containing protein
MNGRAGVWTYLIVAGLVFGVSLGLTGCQKQAPKAPAKSEAKTPEAAPGQPAAQVAEQTTCPVMGGAIDKDIFVEYQGKKVSFCCKECVEKFKAHPDWYLAKLPQFAK